MKKQVKIIGAGFSGLTTAYYLQKAGFEIEIFEEAPQSGGMLSSTAHPLGLVESAANAFMGSERLMALSRDIGLELMKPLKKSRKRFIFRRGEAHRWPLGFFESLVTLLKFLFCRNKKPKAFETIEEWGKRVLGAAATRFLLAPALQGIYAGDPTRLSASLILSRVFNTKKKPKFSGSRAPRYGMGEFSKKLTAYLEKKGARFHYSHPIDSKFIENSSVPVVIATSIARAVELLKDLHPEAAGQLASVETIPLSTATVFFAKENPGLEGFGCLFPRGEGVEALGVLVNNCIFENRSEQISETWIYKGIERNDQDLIGQILKDRGQLVASSAPLDFKLSRWPRALPHYTLELERILEKFPFTELEQKNIYLIGNYLGSLGLTQILERTFEVFQRIAQK